MTCSSFEYHYLSGSDFTDNCSTVIVPAATTPGIQTYTLPQFFTIIDDDMNEVEQSFALLAEIENDNCYEGEEGITQCACFQTQVSETECFGRSGATKIRIKDNNRKWYIYGRISLTHTIRCI